MMNGASDESSVSHGAAGAALQRLVDEYGGQLYHLAFRFCGNREEAEDLVQEVFLKAFRAWGDFRREASERTWLYRIAARTCQRMHRKRSGEPDKVGSLETLLPFGEPLIALVPDDQSDALQQQIHAEARERLEAAISRLPDEFRVPIILKDIVGFSVREVAEILGMEEGTVRSRVHRARLKLRAAVDGAIPRGSTPAPPPAYDQQTCLDLLNAKQEALGPRRSLPQRRHLRAVSLRLCLARPGSTGLPRAGDGCDPRRSAFATHRVHR